MRSAAKKYNTAYKKKIDIDRDTYLPKMSPAGTIQCSGCGAFYQRRHWSLKAPVNHTPGAPAQAAYCPACLKIKSRRASGEVCLTQVPAAERAEVLRLLRNEESRARKKNPLERIMGFEAFGGGWKIHTTTEKLAQRLGRALKKARGGSVAYKWSHNNKFVRVFWDKPKAGAGTR